MNVNRIQKLFKKHGFTGNEWLSCVQGSLQEATLYSYFERWKIRLNLQQEEQLYSTIQEQNLQEDFLYGLGVRKHRFFTNPESFSDMIKYALPEIADPQSAKIFVPFAADGKNVAALTAILYEIWPFACWQVLAEEKNALLSSNHQPLTFDREEVEASGKLFYQSGGQMEWTHNFLLQEDSAVLIDRLKERIQWNSNISSGSLDLIFCPGIMAQLAASYRKEILNLFTQQLKAGGLLILGAFDSLRFSSVADQYEVLTARETVFKKL